MAILKIARMGHPVLLAEAEPVADPTAPEIRELIRDMHDTLADAAGAGLAAPQVHVSKRLILFSAPPERSGEGESVPVTVLVNPHFEPLGPEMELGWEGCLSIPGLRAAVPRYAAIRYCGLDPEGRPVEREASGFHARVVQHEIDHLDGILYPMRMTDFSLMGFEPEWQRYLLDRRPSE